MLLLYPTSALKICGATSGCTLLTTERARRSASAPLFPAEIPHERPPVKISGPFWAAAAANTLAKPSPHEIASTFTVTFGFFAMKSLPASAKTAASASPPVAQMVNVCFAAALAGTLISALATMATATAIAPKRFT